MIKNQKCCTYFSENLFRFWLHSFLLTTYFPFNVFFCKTYNGFVLKLAYSTND